MTNQILEERYEIQKELGHNPGRKTLLAKDLETQELVVIKILHFDGEVKWQDLRLFEREAQILQQLSHPAIPNYLNSFELDLPEIKGFALVQTYIPATSLEEHIQLGRSFNEAEVKQIAKALLEVLNYLHTGQYPVIHRDIKPSNILLGNRSGNQVGDVYLVDFGAVKTAAQNQSGTMTVVGTYGYMAQEQFGGRSVPASDLYSLGATLIYLVTGSHPSDLLDDDMVIEFEKSVNLSPDLIKWLKWMTQTTIKNRPSSAEVALKELERPTPTDSELIVNKPNNSKTILIKEPDKLEIISPPTGLYFPIIVLCFTLLFPISLFMVIVFFGVIYSSITSDGIFVSALTILFFAPILSVIFAVWRKILFTCLGHTYLSINKDKIQRTYKTFYLRYSKSRPIPTSDIYKLEIVDRMLDDNSNKKQKHLVRLIISAGIGTYELANFRPEKKRFWQLKIQPPIFTSYEIYWLAKELSDFLNLPISRETV
ncbi:MAG: serine/threonine-protein kinase [Cyanobacteriota bacterium]|nr:serine/threonine-protein kinase [Cyanobacteriota bacterium]